MDRWVLVEVIEREISIPAFFGRREEAIAEMRRRFAEVLGVEPRELAGIEYDVGDTFIGEVHAYTEKHGQNFDWRIFEE